jgi:hypothetical protein
MGAHVVDVGIEILLGIQVRFFSSLLALSGDLIPSQYSALAMSASGRLGSETPTLLRCMTALFDVLDRIAEQTSCVLSR